MSTAIWMRRLRRGLIGPIAVLPICAPLTLPRELTIEQRIEAQRAIERVYYSHQQGATRSFDEAVPRSVLEAKVRMYLKQSEALDRFWSTPVTAAALSSETRRIARQSLSPGRLRELSTALGDDSFLVQECLVRPSLVSRLTRSFFSTDARIHGAARRDAEDLRQRLSSGTLAVDADSPLRTIVEVVRAEGREAHSGGGTSETPPYGNTGVDLGEAATRKSSLRRSCVPVASGSSDGSRSRQRDGRGSLHSPSFRCSGLDHEQRASLSHGWQACPHRYPGRRTGNT